MCSMPCPAVETAPDTVEKTAAAGTPVLRRLRVQQKGGSEVGRVRLPAGRDDADERTDHQMTKMLDVEEVAAILGCSVAAVRKWQYQGRLRRVKVGRLVRIPAEDVERLCAEGLPARLLRGSVAA
jgi:excisionase family DNA binding protein